MGVLIRNLSLPLLGREERLVLQAQTGLCKSNRLSALAGCRASKEETGEAAESDANRRRAKYAEPTHGHLFVSHASFKDVTPRRWSSRTFPFLSFGICQAEVAGKRRAAGTWRKPITKTLPAWWRLRRSRDPAADFHRCIRDLHVLGGFDVRTSDTRNPTSKARQ